MMIKWQHGSFHLQNLELESPLQIHRETVKSGPIVGNYVFDLTCPGIEPKISRLKSENIIIGQYAFCLFKSMLFTRLRTALILIVYRSNIFVDGQQFSDIKRAVFNGKVN